jgi:hypothetical protein
VELGRKEASKGRKEEEKLLKLDGQRLKGTREGESSATLCDRAPAQARESSARQLPTEIEHAGEPSARSANIRLINRRFSRFDRCPSGFGKQKGRNVSVDSP